MFPDITGQQWCTSSSQKSCSVAGIFQCQLAIEILRQPDPPRIEVVDSRIGELLFERINGTEGTLQRQGQFVIGCSTSIWTQAVPVDGMVPNLGWIVENTVIGTCQMLYIVSKNVILIYIFKVVW